MAGAEGGALSRTLHDPSANANGRMGRLPVWDVLAAGGVRDHHEICNLLPDRAARLAAKASNLQGDVKCPFREFCLRLRR
jgi:hypothetical protein